jgi:fatty acid desaturase
VVSEDLETLARPTVGAPTTIDLTEVMIDLTDGLTVDLVDEASPSAEVGVPAAIRVWAREARVGERSVVRGLRATGEAVAITFGALSVGLFVGGFAGWVVALPGLLVALARIQNLTHEAAHRSVWPSSVANNLTLLVIGVVTLQPAAVYRAFHFAHHRHTRVVGLDPEAFYDRVGSRARYVATLVAGGVVFTLTMWLAWVQVLVGRAPLYARRRSAQREIRLWGSATVVVLVAVISGLTVLGAGRLVLLWWVLPVALYQAGPYTFFTLFEHLNADSSANIVDTSGTLRAGGFVRWVGLNGNFHAAHHTIPSASWWRLPEVDAAIQLWREENNHPVPSGLEHRGVIALHRNLWRSLG